MSAPADEYNPTSEVPKGQNKADTAQDDYQSRTAQDQIPVQSDSAPLDDPIDETTADSDGQLARDDAEAIDKGNIIESRTRGVSADYREPGDEEGLPGPEDGRSYGEGGPV